MNRRTRSTLILGVIAVLLIPIFLMRCCCSKVAPHARPVASAPAPIAFKQFDPPPGITQHGPTAATMRNVDFRVAEQIILRIHSLTGTMEDNAKGPLNFDDKNSFLLTIDEAEIGVDGATLSSLMNDYVLAYPGAPLRNLHITIADGAMTQEGIMHKIIDIPFTMKAEVSATEDARIRIHPIAIQICNLNGKALMQALGVTLEKMLDLRKAKGVTVQKNDLVIDPLVVLPPPKIASRLREVHLEGDEMVQEFKSDRPTTPPAAAPFPAEPNYMYFRGGMLRMGKLFMTEADMQVVDTDPSDRFDFYLDHYNNQLSAGFTRNQPNYGLVVFMRDFADLGSPIRAGERSAASPR